MKRLAIGLLILGLFAGIGQFYVVYNKTYITSETIVQSGCLALSPGCGVCLHQVVGNQCVESFTKKVRGFPLSNAGSGVAYKTNLPINWRTFLNVFIFLLPGLAVFVVAMTKKPQR